METLILTLPQSNRKVHVVPNCGTDRIHCVWLGQISPDFAVVCGGSEDEAHGSFADAIYYPATSNEDLSKLAKEIQADDPDLTEESAWDQATEGCLALNGGAEWIDQDDWGFWSPSVEEEKILKTAAKILEACNDDPETAYRVLRILGYSSEVSQ